MLLENCVWIAPSCYSKEELHRFQPLLPQIFPVAIELLQERFQVSEGRNLLPPHRLQTGPVPTSHPDGATPSWVLVCLWVS